jgi:hypothetical protein
MKKAFTLMSIVLVMMQYSFSQELTSKKGFPVLPEKGDFGLGIDAVPFFTYAGNFFHGNSTTDAPAWDFPNSSYAISGKYFLEANKAIRANVRIGTTMTTDKNLVVNQNQIKAIRTGQYSYKSPNVSYPLNTVEDKRKTTELNVLLGAGIEKRRGKGRVQGVYGAMANIAFGNSSTSFTYGNAMDTGYYFISFSGLTPDTNYREFHRGAISTSGSSFSNSSWTSNRVTKSTSGFSFGLGANVFVGIEYFFATKMSVGGEFSWGFQFTTRGQATITGEKVETVSLPSGGTYHTIKTYEEKQAGGSYFGIDNSATYGAINLSFYF